MTKFIKVICIQYSEFQNKLCKENTVTLLKDFLEEVDLSLSCLLSFFFLKMFSMQTKGKSFVTLKLHILLHYASVATSFPDLCCKTPCCGLIGPIYQFVS